ncbi:hypothetical protein FQA39_LY08020 [Lamprigera yunnana]|nr:hypothetical protein FQA39_LY08020 [Lamprigera yunnana]
MKLLTFILFIVFHSSRGMNFNPVSDYWVGLLEDSKAQCVVSSKMTIDAIDNIIKYGEYKHDDVTKNYFRCLFLNLKIMDENGEVSHDELKKYTGFHDEQLNERLFNTCNKTKVDDLGERAYLLTQCIYFTTKFGIADISS